MAAHSNQLLVTYHAGMGLYSLILKYAVTAMFYATLKLSFRCSYTRGSVFGISSNVCCWQQEKDSRGFCFNANLSCFHPLLAWVGPFPCHLQCISINIYICSVNLQHRFFTFSFTSEGTPVSVDSKGIVRLLNRSFGFTWSQIADLRSHVRFLSSFYMYSYHWVTHLDVWLLWLIHLQCKGKSDNYWVIGVVENPAQIRSVLHFHCLQITC